MWALLTPPISAIVLWPFVGWWFWIIKSTFSNGKIIEAKVTNKHIKYAFDLGIIYQFEYEGELKEHIASLIPNRQTKEMAKSSMIEVVFHPKKDISFIKDLYC